MPQDPSDSIATQSCIDVSSHQLFQTGEVLPLFTKLRGEDPVHYCETSPYGPYWSITSYDDIKAVDTNHEAFSSSFANGGIVIDDNQMNPEDDGAMVMTSFIGLDPPQHRKYRMAVQPIISAKSMKQFEELSRKRTQDVLDALPRDTEFDWVENVSVELTTQMLATLFDFPFEDRKKLREWSDVTTTLEGMPEYISEDYRMQMFAECLQYFTQLREQKSAQEPQFDLVSMLAHDERTRDMSPMDYLSQVLLLIVGGNDTVRNTMSASINVWNLFPEQVQKAKDDASQVGDLVAETIRWQTPIPHMRRTAMADTEVGGKTIRKGDKVVMWYYSGNRDENMFPDGDIVDINRKNVNQHLSFGFGIHRCMGMRIAEMQLKILWEEMFKRFDKIEIAHEPERTCSNQVNGYTRMMVIIPS